MNYFEDYYSNPEEEKEQPNYIPPQQPKPKKERKGNKRSIFDVIWRGVEKVKEETGTLLDDLSKEEV